MGYPLIFDSTATEYASQGYGVLSEAISCLVTENLNGSFELVLQYPANGLHAEYIIPNNILVCRSSLTAVRQAFRIYEVKHEINNIATVYARHISYDLNGYPAEPFTAGTLANALTGLMAGSGGIVPPFTVSADFTSTASFEVTEPSPIRSWFGGREGSIIDVFGGEWEWDNFTCRLRSRRGSDNGVRVQYGKNISSYSKDIKGDGMYSHICVFWKNDTDIVTSSYIATGVTEITKVKYIDVSADYEDAPTTSYLNTVASSKASDYRNMAVSVSVGVIPLNDIQDIIELGDTVHVYYQNDIFITRCVTVVWNVLKDRYDSVSVGALKTSLSETISTSVSADGYITRKDAAAMIQKASQFRIVETGTDNGWMYKKYSDGTYEAYKRMTLTAEACTTTWGSMYVTDAKSFGDRPSFDNQGLEIFVTYASSDGHSGWASNWSAISGTNTGTWVVTRPTSSSSMSGYLCAHLFGKYSGGGGGRIYVTQDADGYIVLPANIP